jgi:HK97 family phage major capsid protein
MPRSNTLLMTDGKDSSSATAGSSTGSYLIPRTLFGELAMAARKNLILRGLAKRVIGPSSIPGSSIDIPMQTPESMVVHRVTEGAAVPLDAEQYSSYNLKPAKYGVRIMISQEMMEDSMFDVMGMNVETAGYEMADNEESLIVSTLDTGSGISDSTRIANSNATLPISDITAAIQGIEEENYTPTDMIVGVEVANDLRNIDTFVEADKTGGAMDPTKRLIGKIFGMNVWVSNNVTSKNAYLIDRREAFVIAEKRPLTIERYKDVGHDTNYAVATQRVAARYHRSAAIARIVTI